MLRNSKESLPDGFKSWKDFNKVKKERRRQNMELKLQRLEEKMAKKEQQAATEKEKPTVSTCSELSTLSIAVPGSILDNAQSLELRTYLAGQIARAACVFKVTEVVVYDDVGIQNNAISKSVASTTEDGEVRIARKCCAQLARILQYLECPQYLRRDFFPKHSELQYAGLLNPLDAPHHVRQEDESQFREGIVINQPAKNGCYVNVGLLKHVKVDLLLQPGVRVTVKMLPTDTPEAKRLHGQVVPPSRPTRDTGIYWGYSVRVATSLSAVFTECPYKEGYDLTVGTSERGKAVESVTMPKHKHAIVVFGGLAGIEAALEADQVLQEDDPSLLFDYYLNTCPGQGSRTIRTEEAILITLAELRTKLKPEVTFSKPVLENDEETDRDDDEDDARSENEAPCNNEQRIGDFNKIPQKATVSHTSDEESDAIRNKSSGDESESTSKNGRLKRNCEESSSPVASPKKKKKSKKTKSDNKTL